MSLYFILNLAISLIVFFGVLMMNDAPSREKFRLCMFALICWCLPLQLLANLQLGATEYALLNDIRPVAKFIVEKPQEFILKPLESYSLDWKIIFYLCTGIGISLFLYDIAQHFLWVKRSQKSTTFVKSVLLNNKKISVYTCSQIDGALTLGFYQPQIWVSNKIQTNMQSTVLMHELIHIQNKDPYWLILIHMIKRAFWWNPIVQILVKESIELLELSCDEKCKQSMKKGEYQSCLAELVLQAKGNKTLAMASHFIFSGKSFDVKRIKLLNKELTMNLKNKTSLCLLLAIMCGVLALPAYSWIENSAREPMLIEKVSEKGYKIKVDKMPYRSLGLILTDVYGIETAYIDPDIIDTFYSLDLSNAKLDDIIQEIHKLNIAKVIVQNNYAYIVSFDYVLNESTKWSSLQSELVRVTRLLKSNVQIYQNEKLVVDSTILHEFGKWSGLEKSGYELEIRSNSADFKKFEYDINLLSNIASHKVLLFNTNISTELSKELELSSPNVDEKETRLVIKPIKVTHNKAR